MENLILYAEQARSLRPIPVGKDTIFVSLIEEGQITYRIDEIDFTAHAGDIIVLIHNKGAEVIRTSDDYSARVALLARSYVDVLHIPNTYRMFLTLRRNPVLHLDRESYAQMENCFNLIGSTMRNVRNTYRKQTIYYAVKTYLYTLAYLSQPDNLYSPTREEDISMRFLDMVEELYREQHGVAYYANVLHITPKYLSACVKSATGKTAMECIAERLLTKAQKKLSDTDSSISEVCYELGFADPSAFGKFFRNHAGIGPREWRRKTLSGMA